MKVICISNYIYDKNNKYHIYSVYRVRIGKEYDCIKEDEYEYLIFFDNFSRWYPKYLFITKEEIRSKRLEEIGI